MKVIAKPQLVLWQQKLVSGFVKEAIHKKRKDTIAANSVVTSEMWTEDWIEETFSGKNTSQNNSYPYVFYFFHPKKHKGANQHHQNQSTKASEFGIRVHQWIEWALLHTPAAAGLPKSQVSNAKALKTTKLPPSVKPIVEAAIKWVESSQWKLVALEHVVYSPTLGYAGTVDAIFRKEDGSLVIVDWKTTNTVQPDYAMQLSAYAHAVAERNPGEKVSEAVVIRFDKVPEEKYDSVPISKIEQKRVKSIEESFETFKGCLKIFSYIQQRGAVYEDVKLNSTVVSETTTKPNATQAESATQTPTPTSSTTTTTAKTTKSSAKKL